MLVVVAIIFICCEGVFAVEQLLTIRNAHQPTSSNKRLLRKHIVSDDYTKAGEGKFGKEDRVSPRIFSDKFLSKAATTTSPGQSLYLACQK
ncbi:Hypothetical protein PHPALM_11520 [Phytophthora palmivora]|uniref:RxLR effector n=1 Tax=Phytophthora palmivora TaxID=4796 RepID=A0A2P4Y222_9STRA|nr:Hypothetical protein PHPALM_11520 [Phytophthora palmivora]